MIERYAMMLRHSLGFSVERSVNKSLVDMYPVLKGFVRVGEYLSSREMIQEDLAYLGPILPSPDHHQIK